MMFFLKLLLLLLLEHCCLKVIKGQDSNQNDNAVLHIMQKLYHIQLQGQGVKLQYYQITKFIFKVMNPWS